VRYLYLTTAAIKSYLISVEHAKCECDVSNDMITVLFDIIRWLQSAASNYWGTDAHIFYSAVYFFLHDYNLSQLNLSVAMIMEHVLDTQF